MDLETYKQDERQSILGFTLNATHDSIARQYEAWLMSGRAAYNNIFLSKIAAYAGLTGTCLDVGMAYGAQYFALKQLYPGIVWTGCEIARSYIDKFTSRFEEGKCPPILQVTEYSTLPVSTSSFDVVTARSVLRHYTPENGFKIIDEMLRVCKTAVILKFATPIHLEEDLYTEAFGAWTGKGYYIEWSKGKWDKYCSDGKRVVESGHELVYVILKEV